MSEFFRKLIDLTGLEESIEGIRNILSVIYRTGTVSVKEISRKTHIPVPVVSKIVNILIERNMLSRRKEGVQLWEHSMKFVEDFFQFYGYGIEKCPKCKGRPYYITPRIEILFEYLNPIFGERPEADTRYDQSKNTPETAIQRVLYLYDKGCLEGKDIVFLGDDDFTSSAVAYFFKIFFPNDPELIPNSVTVLDIDERILRKLKSVYNDLGLEIACIKYDARKPLDGDLIGQFDTVITDPPYSINGLRLFVSRAVSLLRKPDKYNTGKDIILSYAHRSQEKMLEIQRILNKMGLAVMEIIPRFNKYEGSEILGNETQLIRLKSTLKTSPIIQPESEFNEPIYTGETRPFIRKYKCKNCGEIIEVGPDREFETIEILKGKRCPKCGVSKKFDLIEKNLDIPVE